MERLKGRVLAALMRSDRPSALARAAISIGLSLGKSFEALRGCQEIVGQAGYLPAGSPGAALAGQLEQAMRGLLILTYGGGTNELQRDIIAMFGLGMPRADR